MHYKLLLVCLFIPSVVSASYAQSSFSGIGDRDRFFVACLAEQAALASGYRTGAQYNRLVRSRAINNLVNVSSAENDRSLIDGPKYSARG